MTTRMARSADAGPITLSDGLCEIDISPGNGATITRYERRAGASGMPIFAATPFGSGSDAVKVACILLVPWSNRISGGGFHHAGRFVTLSPNLQGEKYPIHGNAFQARWSVSETTGTMARLNLESDGPGDFRYDAEAIYTLADGALKITLSLANRAEVPLPYGLGVHPWLPRTPRTELWFNAGGVWLEDGDHLPADHLPITQTPAWDFSTTRPLPSGWINNAFSGWDGRAHVVWPEHHMALDIEGSALLSTCIVYSPGRHADFFCFEPVTHPVDAHNMPAGPGLVVLAPGEAFEVWARFVPRPLN